MTPLEIGLLIAIVTIVLLGTGMPIAFGLGFVAVAFMVAFQGASALGVLAETFFSGIDSFALVSLPMFILMGAAVASSPAGRDLYIALDRWLNRVPGGIVAANLGACSIFAALSGSSPATCAAIGKMGIPEMRQRGYPDGLATGAIAAGGTLGILIPPSVTMIVYASMTGVSVGKLFIAGILPGLLLAGMFIIYIAIRCILNPKLGPSLPPESRGDWTKMLKSLGAVVLPLILVFSVIGSILLGLATPTEAAAIGAVGSLTCAAVNRKLTWKNFAEASRKSLVLSTMIIWIVVTATAFSNVYTALGAPDFLNSILEGFGVGRWTVLLAIQMTFFFLGMVMDPIGIVMITTPVYIPIIKALGFNPIWFGILFIINMEMGYLTPPFGYNLFYMRSIVPTSLMSMRDLYYSVLPFILIQAICLVTIMVFPQIALWLPDLIQ